MPTSSLDEAEPAIAAYRHGARAAVRIPRGALQSRCGAERSGSSTRRRSPATGAAWQSTLKLPKDTTTMGVALSGLDRHGDAVASYRRVPSISDLNTSPRRTIIWPTRCGSQAQSAAAVACFRQGPGDQARLCRSASQPGPRAAADRRLCRGLAGVRVALAVGAATGRPAQFFATASGAATRRSTAKTILLHAEQGLGDTIQFCRLAKPLWPRAARMSSSRCNGFR